MVKKNDAPTEIETITLTMSRPVAEAVQAACEWYLRLHMGQFWDLAEDLCFAKFYSDAENNAFQSEEQRKNAFNVAIGRRNTMLLEMERLYSRCVLPAPTSDVMKVPYRAEQVILKAKSLEIQVGGATVTISEGGEIKVTSPAGITLAASGELKMTASTINATAGTVNIQGGGGDVVVSGKSLVSHTHTGNLGKKTSAPL